MSGLKPGEGTPKHMGYVTRHRLATMLGWWPHVLNQAVKYGIVPGPTHKWGSRHYYTTQEAEAIVQKMNEQKQG